MAVVWHNERYCRGVETPPSSNSQHFATAGDSMTRLTASGPFRPAPKFLGYFVVACIVTVNIVGFLVGGAWSSLLDKHPLALIALQARYRYMVVTAPKIDIVPYFLVGLGRLLLSDPVYFLLGWFWGDKAIAYFNNALGKTTIDNTRRFFLRAAPVMALFFAGPVICVLAGAAKMKPRIFFALNIVGTAIIVVLLRAFSASMNDFIQSFLRFNKRYNKWIILISVGTTLFLFATAGAKQMRAAKSLSDDMKD
jgi:membrane protein DedA with SNARE-associated domain